MRSSITRVVGADHQHAIIKELNHTIIIHPANIHVAPCAIRRWWGSDIDRHIGHSSILRSPTVYRNYKNGDEINLSTLFNFGKVIFTMYVKRRTTCKHTYTPGHHRPPDNNYCPPTHRGLSVVHLSHKQNNRIYPSVCCCSTFEAPTTEQHVQFLMVPCLPWTTQYMPPPCIFSKRPKQSVHRCVASSWSDGELQQLNVNRHPIIHFHDFPAAAG